MTAPVEIHPEVQQAKDQLKIEQDLHKGTKESLNFEQLKAQASSQMINEVITANIHLRAGTLFQQQEINKLKADLEAHVSVIGGLNGQIKALKSPEGLKVVQETPLQDKAHKAAK